MLRLLVTLFVVLHVGVQVSYGLDRNLLLDLLSELKSRSNEPVEVHVVYCGGCGYGSRFRRFQTEIEDATAGFSTDVRVAGESSQGITGYFEVTVNGDLIHSKKNGDGFVDSSGKLDKIVKAIKAAQ